MELVKALIIHFTPLKFTILGSLMSNPSSDLIEKHLLELQDICTTLDDDEQKLEDQIQSTIQTLREKISKILKKQEEELIKQGREIFKNKRKSLDEQLSQFKELKLKRSIYLEERLEDKLAGMEKDIKASCLGLNKHFLATNVGVSCDNEDITACIQRQLCRIQLHNEQQSDTSQDDKVISCVAGFTKQLALPKDIPHANWTFETHLEGELTTAFELSYQSDGTCTFTPTNSGCYNLKTIVDDCTIVKRVAVRPYDRPYKPLRNVVNPRSRYCSIRGNELFVTCRCNPNMHVYDLETGKMLRTLCGDFKRGRGIVLRKDCLYVTDAGRSQFAKVSYDTKISPVWYSREGEAKGELKWPLGMEMDDQGRLFIANKGNKRIEIFKPSYSPIDWEPDYNITLDYEPYDLAFDSDDNIHIACGEKNEKVDQIFIYTIDGHKIGEYGNGLICGPGGIAIDKYGYRYVTEYSLEGRLVIFNREGQVVSTSDPLNYPMGVCIDTDGSIYVACNLSHRVVQF